MNDDAGNVVALTQNASESPEALGKRLADALEPATKSLEDAKACVDQRNTKTDKAIEAANKAIKQVPDHGLAHYCLAQIAQAKKAPRGEIVKHLQAAAKGDPQSLQVWTALATEYQAANDTANTLVAFKQMLRVAPTNQKLREELFKYFLQSGHPETALEVADEGLKIDPVQRRPVRPEEQRLPVPQQLQVRRGCPGDDVRHRLHQGGHALLHQDQCRRG